MTADKNNQELHVVGQSVPRRDGLGHVKGSTVFYEDRQINGLLTMKMVRSPVPHGKINGIDFSEAEKVRGFVAHLYHPAPYRCRT
jgi:putative selenate reductase molybdopterin-binding subunit